MIEYFVVKEEKFSEVINTPKSKDITFIQNGTIDLNNLKTSSTTEDIFKIPQKNQQELNEKGETEFMIITKTIVNLKRNIGINKTTKA